MRRGIAIVSGKHYSIFERVRAIFKSKNYYKCNLQCYQVRLPDKVYENKYTLTQRQKNLYINQKMQL